MWISSILKMASCGCTIWLYEAIVFLAIWNLEREIHVLGFSRHECLTAHNDLRQKHVRTQSLKYSGELEKEAQEYADKLAETDDWRRGVLPTQKIPRRRRAIPATPKFFHKEMWDGEILFPTSKWDINRRRKVPVGENIHMFCCYSYPYCPKEFFYQMDFPPSPKSVVEHWYKSEIDNYDFKKGIKRNKEEDIIHFTNIVWKSTHEVGCAQSKRSRKGCIYTVTRYRVQGSVGWPDNFKANVMELSSSTKKDTSSSNTTILMVFLVVLVIIVLVVAAVILCFKREYIRHKYTEFMIMRNIKRSERSPGEDDCLSRIFPCLAKKNVIYKPSTRDRKYRPTIEVITDGNRNQSDDLEETNPDIDVVYENVPKKSVIRIPRSKKSRSGKAREQPSAESPSVQLQSSHPRDPLLPRNQRHPGTDQTDIGRSDNRPASNGNIDHVNTYVNVDIGPCSTQGGRPLSKQATDNPKPLPPPKTQVHDRPAVAAKPSPALRPSSAAGETGAATKPPLRNVNSADNQSRPVPAPRKNVRPESDSKALSPSDVKTELNKVKKVHSSDFATRTKPQLPLRPETNKLSRLSYDSNESTSPKEPPEKSFIDAGGGNRILEMKKRLGNQGIR